MKAFSCMAFCFVLTVGVSANAAPAPPVAKPDPASRAALDPESLALAHQILTIAFPPEKRADMWNSVMGSIIDQARHNVESQLPADQNDKELNAIVNRSTDRMIAELKAVMNASIPDYFESFARAYARDFSRDDLRTILAFVETPAGAHYFARAPGLLKDPDVQAAGQRMTERLFSKAPEMETQMKRDIQAYVARQQGKAKSSAPGHGA